MNSFYADAKRRMPSQKVRILDLLKERGKEGATNLELNRISLRYTDRIFQLKNAGYIFQIDMLDHGVTKYVLLEEPKGKKEYLKGIWVVADIIDNDFDGSITSFELENLLDNLGMNIVRRPNVLNKRVTIKGI